MVLLESSFSRALELEHGEHVRFGPCLAVHTRPGPKRPVLCYAEVLRLPEIEKKTTRANVRWFGLGAGRAIHLILGATDVPASKPRSTHFALASSSFDEALRQLAGCGVAFQDLSGALGQVSVRPDGVRQVYFQDPDGHWIEINDAPVK